MAGGEQERERGNMGDVARDPCSVTRDLRKRGVFREAGRKRLAEGEECAARGKEGVIGRKER